MLHFTLYCQRINSPSYLPSHCYYTEGTLKTTNNKKEINFLKKNKKKKKKTKDFPGFSRSHLFNFKVDRNSYNSQNRNKNCILKYKLGRYSAGDATLIAYVSPYYVTAAQTVFFMTIDYKQFHSMIHFFVINFDRYRQFCRINQLSKFTLKFPFRILYFRSYLSKIFWRYYFAERILISNCLKIRVWSEIQRRIQGRGPRGYGPSYSVLKKSQFYDK